MKHGQPSLVGVRGPRGRLRLGSTSSPNSRRTRATCSARRSIGSKRPRRPTPARAARRGPIRRPQEPRFGATVPRWFKVCDQAVDDQRLYADIDPTTRPDSYGSHTEPESPPMMPAATPTRRKYWLRITTYIPMTIEQRADDGVGGELAAHCAAVEVVGKLSVEAERPYGVEHPHDPREDQHYRREPKPSPKALQP